MKVIPVLFAILTSIHINIAQAESVDSIGESQAAQVALEARNGFVKSLINRDFVGITHEGFDHAIRDFADQLATDQNDPAAAKELITRWESGESDFQAALFAASFDDLGDHAPLFPWIEAYINKLSDKYGSIILNLPIIKTIQTLNFAIPVVFRPNGEWQMTGVDNRIEYRKHFIPFANIITYYVSLYACNVFTVKSGYPQLKRFCKTAAQKLEFVMGRYIAAPVSDFIFKASHRVRVRQPSMGRDQLRYENGEDLASDIRQGLILQ